VRAGFTVTGFDLRIHGRCADCTASGRTVPGRSTPDSATDDGADDLPHR
jgi:hypothetical protein